MLTDTLGATGRCGGEVAVAEPPVGTCSELWAAVEEALQVPIREQRLLWGGQPLRHGLLPDGFREPRARRVRRS